jgi:hypothetical protein
MATEKKSAQGGIGISRKRGLAPTPIPANAARW